MVTGNCFDASSATVDASLSRSHTADRSEHRLIDTSCKSASVALMPKAVQFDSYGGIDVLEVRDVPRPFREPVRLWSRSGQPA